VTDTGDALQRTPDSFGGAVTVQRQPQISQIAGRCSSLGERER